MTAHSTRDVSTDAASAGIGGAVGIGGVVGVTLVGGHLSGADLLSQLDADGDGTLAVADEATTGRRFTADDGDGAGNIGTGHAISAAELDEINAEGRVSVRDSLTSALDYEGTVAVVGEHTVLDAGRNVTVQAQEDVAIALTTGAVAGSAGLSIGGSVGITDVTLNVAASVHGSAVVQAVDNVSILAGAAGLRGDRPALGVISFQGSAGVAALGAAVADARLTSNTTAVIGAGAQIEAGHADITVAAIDETDVKARAEGYVGGLAAAAGIVLADAVKTGSTEARITGTTGVPATSVWAGEGNISITALRQSSIDAYGKAGIGGIVAGGAVDVTAREDGASRALVGNGVTLTARGVNALDEDGKPVLIDGTVRIDAAARPDVTAKSL